VVLLEALLRVWVELHRWSDYAAAAVVVVAAAALSVA
jgi:hypothetical protein